MTAVIAEAVAGPCANWKRIDQLARIDCQDVRAAAVVVRS